MTLMVRMAAGVGLVSILLAQPSPKQTRPLRAQSASSIVATTGTDGSETVEIRNVTYEITGEQVRGRAASERLVLRKTVHSKQVLGDIGEDSTVSLEAWRLGDDLAQKPLYALNVSGGEIRTEDNALLIASRGLEEVEWWSVYKLGSGQHLFDTYVPLVRFSISRETVQTRYVGLEVPADDIADARLKQPNVVGVLTYASGERVMREALLTSDDAPRAKLLRSFADVTRMVSVDGAPPRSVRVSFSQNYPSAANAAEVVIPIVRDDLDLGHAQLPARVHISAWRR
ncbi:MAG TPA: hypothetical protein VLY24_30440 [Bryobacteraceae bacterium]|nr:hypothetical protein [Bryobacteraceae bacterium]